MFRFFFGEGFHFVIRQFLRFRKQYLRIVKRTLCGKIAVICCGNGSKRTVFAHFGKIPCAVGHQFRLL